MRERSPEQLLLSRDGGVAGLLPEHLRTLPEEDGGERLGNGHRESRDDTREDHVDPHDPPPADRLTDESADDRTKDGTAVRRSGEQSDGHTTLIVVPNVGDGTAGKGEWRRREDTAEETADKERLDVFGKGTGDVEDHVDDAGDHPDGSATVQFALQHEVSA